MSAPTVHDLREMHEDDMSEIKERITGLDTRVVVLEQRAIHLEKRLDSLYMEMQSTRLDIKEVQGEVKRGMDYVAQMLRTHIDTENRGRVRLAWSGLLAAVGAMGTLAILFLQMWFHHIDLL